MRAICGILKFLAATLREIDEVCFNDVFYLIQYKQNILIPTCNHYENH